MPLICLVGGVLALAAVYGLRAILKWCWYGD